MNPQESASSILGNSPHSKYGFRTVEDKSELPDKIFKDCQNCPRLHRCDEVAMVRGRIPRMSILGPREEAQQLVRLCGQRRPLRILVCFSAHTTCTPVAQITLHPVSDGHDSPPTLN